MGRINYHPSPAHTSPQPTFRVLLSTGTTQHRLFEHVKEKIFLDGRFQRWTPKKTEKDLAPCAEKDLHRFGCISSGKSETRGYSNQQPPGRELPRACLAAGLLLIVRPRKLRLSGHVRVRVRRTVTTVTVTTPVALLALSCYSWTKPSSRRRCSIRGSFSCSAHPDASRMSESMVYLSINQFTRQRLRCLVFLL